MELGRFQKKNLNKALVFKLPGDWTLKQEKNWMEALGMECARAGQCEAAVKSKIQILHFSARWGRVRISGNFMISLKDGRKLEGSFSANGVRPSNKIICE